MNQDNSATVLSLHERLLADVSKRVGDFIMDNPVRFAQTMARWYLDEELPPDALLQHWHTLTHEAAARPYFTGNRPRFLAKLIADATSDASKDMAQSPEVLSLQQQVERAARDNLARNGSFLRSIYQDVFLEAQTGWRVRKENPRILTPATEMSLLLWLAAEAFDLHINDPKWWVLNGLPLYRTTEAGSFELVPDGDPVVQFLLLSHRFSSKPDPQDGPPEWMRSVFIRARDKETHDWVFAGGDCYELTGEAHSARRKALRRQLDLPDFEGAAPAVVQEVATAPYLQSGHPRYAAKLAAAVRAWEAVVEPAPGTTIKQSLERWLAENAERFALSGNAIVECSAVANWNQRGGAPKTPG